MDKWGEWRGLFILQLDYFLFSLPLEFTQANSGKKLGGSMFCPKICSGYDDKAAE